MHDDLKKKHEQNLLEDNVTNRMVESLGLFGEISNSRWFSRTSIVLFLNKKDLFEERIKNTPITVCSHLADYDGKQDDFKETTDFIIEKYLECVLNDKPVTVHLTCATDQKNVQRVFEAVQEVVLNDSLESAGLMI